MSRLTVLRRLIAARHRRGFSSGAQRLAFYLQLNPVLNASLTVAFGAMKNKQSRAAKLARHAVRAGFGFGALRNMTPEARNSFAAVVLDMNPISDAEPSIQRIVDEIRRVGYCRMGYVSPETVEAAKEHFAARPYFNAQVPGQSDGKPVYQDWRAQMSGPAERYVSFAAKDLLDFVMRPGVVDIKEMKSIADAYCGFDTVLYGVNTMGTYPGEGMGYAMRTHRDYDDFSFLAFFIAWTKTTEDNGATLFLPGSHHSSAASGPLVSLDCEPGDVVALDGFGLHAGNPRVKVPRLTTWLRYGNPANLVTAQEGDL